MNASKHLDIFNQVKIGIVGCGHLGRAVLTSLLNHGFPQKSMYISYQGKPSTYEKIKQLGLTECIADNKRIFREADIVFLTIRPQDMNRLQGIDFPRDTQIVSCIAGLTTGIAKDILNTSIFRIMLSGPDTIVSARGIAAMYPYNNLVGDILKRMGLRIFEVSQESDMDIFTAGVCLPAALLLENSEAAIQEAIREVSTDYATFFEIYRWAQEIAPFFHTESEKAEYISKMITKGGVTETIVASIQSGESFLTALRRGIRRSKDISQEIGNSILM
ncbi:hypothetical protein P22_1336 [Propionispora sp. 2/2-37]|uniref:pyrroline-5-carboxylate reductase family protein n=1 Tax=Propionispora sp. 2/2-37 TaxID=1677858 RepID=UPI0006BB6E02|nr:NAD(P)-binding domain-containing protein [Propionispora sp. 2/2-37]CUH95266.1 hypothetical protein P22_1336 [Propionispora sp. 2/2-37]